MALPPRDPFRGWMLRWGHSVVWVFMALGCFLVGANRMMLAKGAAWGAFGIYLIFMTLFLGEQWAIKNSAAAPKKGKEIS